MRLSRTGWALLRVDSEREAEILHTAFNAATQFFGQPDVVKCSAKVNSKIGYKKHAQKERFQYRAGHKCPFANEASAAEEIMRTYAMTICQGALKESVLDEFCADDKLAIPSSVFNFYR